MTNSKTSDERVRWSVKRRLEFIELRLYWDGRVNRGDLTSLFGISAPQASADLGRYQERAPSNMIYDAQMKCYVASAGFQPALLEPDAQRYLTQLRLLKEGVLEARDVWAGRRPPFDIVPTIDRPVDPAILRRVLDAIHTGGALSIFYRSLSRPEPIWRWITPHALAYDGARWHVRAWCRLNKDFRDFLLSRIRGVADAQADDVDAADDSEWQTVVPMRIGPHPGLSPEAQRTIALDYGMENEELVIETRVCLSFYLERRLNLDLDSTLLGPKRQQLVLLNRDEVDEIRRRAKFRGAPGEAANAESW